MNSIVYKFLSFILIIFAFIGMSSYILLNDIPSPCTSVLNPSECEEVASNPSLLTSTGDFVGFYTTLPVAPGGFPIEVVSFPAFSAGTTTLQGTWSSTINFSLTNKLLPTNTSAYNPVLKELVCLISNEQQLLEYEDINMFAPTPINVFPTTATAPVYFNNSYFAIEIENNGYADLPLFEADIVNFDFQTATFSSVLHLQFSATPFSSLYHEIVSSATNNTDELYFLAGSNLIIVTDLSIWTPNYCWIDLDPNSSTSSSFYFYGVEYKSPGVLMAIRETFTNGNRIAVDLVEIIFNSTTCTVSNINVIYDMMNNFMPSPAGWIVNSEFYSTTYDACRKKYYLSTLFNHSSDSRLVEIDVQNANHVEQILPEYLFAIEWKQDPCPCVASFAIQQFSGCGKFNFINTSTGSAPMTCYWDFDDPNSGITNTSVQCQEMHQFSGCGSYNVCLTINANECIKTTCQMVTVTDIVPPVALCKSGVSIALDANCIATLQPSDIDNGSHDDCFIQTLNLSQTTFTACGNYTVTLTVTDWCGNTSVCNTLVQVVDNSPPVIICPANVYLSTADPSCSMVVNGLQWIVLTDNCGTPTVTYTITGNTNHAGNGDASGLLFNAGISVITYIAIDQCGNSASCTFTVTVICGQEPLCTNNLVQNPQFELYTTCPTTIGLIQNANFWSQPTLGSSDFYHGCAPAGSNSDVPNNNQGTQIANSGVGYVGAIMHMQNPYREYLETQLLTPLNTGISYKVSFYVSLGDNSRFATDNIGVYFSLGSVGPIANAAPLTFTPQIVSQPGNHITNQNGWTLITGIFTPANNYTHMVIGIFGSGTSTVTVNTSGSSFSYYYVDDVSVCELVHVGTNDDQDPKVVRIYPNPNNGYFKVDVSDFHDNDKVIRVAGLTGERYSEVAIGKGESAKNIDVSLLPAGLYFIQIISGNRVLSVNRFIKL